jgi:hypothetical protein
VSATESESSPSSTTSPIVQVVRGNPSPEELAVVVAVIAASGGGEGSGGGVDDRIPSGWTDRSRGVRATPHARRGGWRASAFPPAT